MVKRVLVTGGLGFIGSSLVRELVLDSSLQGFLSCFRFSTQIS
jgi:nucleoside-diphosphate-sugar epimerase